MSLIQFSWQSLRETPTHTHTHARAVCSDFTFHRRNSVRSDGWPFVRVLVLQRRKTELQVDMTERCVSCGYIRSLTFEALICFTEGRP